MAFIARRIVSKQKIRYQEEGFDLDLTYVTPRIIAMGFPSSNAEGLYRNNLQEVVRFFETKHKGFYKVYNLCSEKAYDPSLFNGRVERFPFNDHNPCPFEMIMPFCRSVDEWLNQNPSNIAIVHCKAGKGRTGLMICAYMVYCGMQKTADQSLDYYAWKRTKDRQGVTIPSQIRYVKYFGECMTRGGRPPYPRQALYIDKIIINNPPKNFGPILYKIRDKNDVDVVVYKQNSNVKIRNNTLELPCEPRVPLCDDLKFIFKEKKLLSPTQKDLFHFWINTCFINKSYVCIPKLEIDRLHRDIKHKEYPKDFRVEIFFTLAPYPDSSFVPEARITRRDDEDPPSEESSRDSDEYTDPDFINNLEQEYNKNKR
jgi:phosphatidylinositol-3,4,5-trisphosphate 3-phosphatase/dual-specificity protein phosphatase PTEN